MKHLIIAPHPDDEVLGVGGTILKNIDKGEEIYTCIITRAYLPDLDEKTIKKKREEVIRVNDYLGVKEVFFCDFPTLKLETLPRLTLKKSLTNIINNLKPDIMYLPHKGDINTDHKLTFQAAMVVARPKPDFFIKKIYSYETLSSTDWAPQSIENIFIPNLYEDISKFLDKKKRALQLYESEIQKYPHPRSVEGIEILAKKRGLEVGMLAAEAFMLIREIKD
jgi:LmbE family N-acetylglucosaminyl deacetylase